MCAFVLTRIDYCNGVLANLPDSAFTPLQRLLHTAARFVADLGPRDHVTSTLVSLHWLPIRQRITYELCTMMHSVFYDLAPVYISNIVTKFVMVNTWTEGHVLGQLYVAIAFAQMRRAICQR